MSGPAAPRCDVGQFLALTVAAGLETSLLSGSFHEDSPHRLGGGAEEVSPAIPLVRRISVDQADIGLG